MVIIIAGGFHTKGITANLKEKDISFVVVAPNVKTAKEKDTVYFSLLKDKKLPIQNVLNEPDTLQIINSISDPQARQQLINYWTARATRYYSPEELKAQLDGLNLSASDRQAAQLALQEIIPQQNHQDLSVPVSQPVQQPVQKKSRGPKPPFLVMLGLALSMFLGLASPTQAQGVSNLPEARQV